MIVDESIVHRNELRNTAERRNKTGRKKIVIAVGTAGKRETVAWVGTVRELWRRGRRAQKCSVCTVDSIADGAVTGDLDPATWA